MKRQAWRPIALYLCQPAAFESQIWHTYLIHQNHVELVSSPFQFTSPSPTVILLCLNLSHSEQLTNPGSNFVRLPNYLSRGMLGLKVWPRLCRKAGAGPGTYCSKLAPGKPWKWVRWAFPVCLAHSLTLCYAWGSEVWGSLSWQECESGFQANAKLEEIKPDCCLVECDSN